MMYLLLLASLIIGAVGVIGLSAMPAGAQMTPLISGVVLGIGLLLAVGWQLQRAIIEPIHEAVAISKQIAVGYLANTIGQGVGIDRVAHLMVEIDMATQQNVLMVENAADSARTLQAQGRDLLRTAAVFRLS